MEQIKHIITTGSRESSLQSALTRSMNYCDEYERLIITDRTYCELCRMYGDAMHKVLVCTVLDGCTCSRLIETLRTMPRLDKPLCLIMEYPEGVSRDLIKGCIREAECKHSVYIECNVMRPPRTFQNIPRVAVIVPGSVRTQ